MKKLLAIFALLLTLACSVVLFACEDSTKDPSTSSDTAVKITDENGVCIEGAVDPASTISISEVTNAEDLQEVQDLVELTYDNYTIQKAFQFSILLNKRTQTIDGRLDYSIPQKVLGLSWEDNNKYVFIGIKNNNDAEYISYTNLGSTIQIIDTIQFKYLVLAQLSYNVPHAHDFVYVKGKLATFFEEGLASHYICTDEQCKDKYFNWNMQEEVTYESLVLPKYSRDIVLYAGDEARAEFELTKDTGDYLEFTATNVDLKKGEKISLKPKTKLYDEHLYVEYYCFAPDSETYEQFPDNNYIERGDCVHNDVDDATVKISLIVKPGYYNSFYINISGVVYNYAFKIYPFEGNYSEKTVYATLDENGVFTAKDILIRHNSHMYIYKQTKHGNYSGQQRASSVTTNESVYNGTWYFNVYNKGIYDISFDPQTEKLTVNSTYTYPTPISQQGRYIIGSKTIYVGGDINDEEAFLGGILKESDSTFYIYIRDYNGKDVTDLTIAQDSVDYIHLSDNGKYIYFDQIGSYDLIINQDTRVVRAIKYDVAPKYVINHTRVGVKGAQEKDDLVDANVVGYMIYEPNYCIYPGDAFSITDDRNCLDLYLDLSDATDEQYVKKLYNTLWFKKAGYYRFVFDTASKTIDIMLLKETESQDKLIPKWAIKYANAFNGGSYNAKSYNLLKSNSSNEQEMCILGYTYTENQFEKYLRFVDEDESVIFNITLDPSCDALATVGDFIGDGVNYSERGALMLKAPGTYNIYINKDTYVVRVELVE